MSPRWPAIAVAASLTLAPLPVWAQSTPGQRTPPRATRPGEEQPKSTAVIRGAVVALDTGAPIRRAQVRAAAADSQDSRSTLTDEQGRFELKELAGGHYTITATKGGFVSLQYGQRRPSEPGTAVDLGPGQAIDKLVIGLPRGSVITGRIVDEFGEPLTGAQVRVLRYAWVQGARRLVPAGQADRTDDQGSYRIFGLSPGEYVVSASLNDAGGGGRFGGFGPFGGRGSDEEQSPTGYAPTYFPGTTSVGGAQRVQVGLAQEVGGVGFGLSLMRLAKVRGRVLGTAGMEVGGMVMAMPDTGLLAGLGTQRGGPVDADGQFEINGLAPGRYTLVAGPRGRRNGDEPVGRTPIAVSGVDLSGVTVALAPPAALRGVVQTDTGAVGLRAGQIRVTFASPESTVQPGMGRQGRVNDDFTFELLGITEPGYVRVTPPSGWYLKAILRDGQDITDASVSLENGAQVTGVRVVLTQSATTVTGTVRDARGNAVLDTTVLVFPEDESKWQYQSRFVSAARPDTSGQYEIKGLPPSEGYRIIAVQALENGQSSDPDFLRSLRDAADRLSLNENETKAVDLRLKQ
jgi:hypothetical protein